VSRLVVALFAFVVSAPCAYAQSVRTIERAEILLTGERALPDDAGGWAPVALPHNWHANPPAQGSHAWYRIRFTLDVAPRRGQSIYVPRLVLGNATVYVNREPIWKLSEAYAPDISLTSLRIPIPPGLLRAGENTLHLEIRGDSQWFYGVSRLYFGDTKVLSERAAMRGLLQGQMIHIVAAAFGSIGFLALLLWHRAGRNPLLFWYGVSGVTLLAVTTLWYVTMWRTNFEGWRPGLVSLRYHGYLVPLFILHLRLAGRRYPWLEAGLWFVLVAAFAGIAVPSRWQPDAWAGSGMAFAALPALLTLPLLISPQLRTRLAVLVLVVADVAASVLSLHDWAVRFGLLDFDRPYLIYFAPPFVMLAAAVPILDRMLAGVKATEQIKAELELRVAEKAREIEASHEHLRLAQREQEFAAERRRIMADMHDGLGARLVSLLSIAQSGKARHGEISEGLAAALNELRLIVDSVQPVEGDVAVVLGNVRHRMRSVFERAGVKFLWNVSALPRMENLTPERILAIQRIFLVVFSNTLRHAGARTVAVSAVRLPGAVQIVIADDGRGFEEGSVRSGNGLANLRLRAAQAGGTLVVESEPGSGTRVTLTLPVPDGRAPDLPGTGQTQAPYPVQGISPAPESA
jgi:hypothetical protein